MTAPLGKTLLDIVRRLPRRRRAQLAMLLGLMLGGAIAEVVSLGAIIPFLAILVDPDRALQTPMLARLVHALGLAGIAEDLRWQLTLLFALAAVAAGAMRFALIYATAKVNYGMGHELGREVYRRTLYQPYEVHVARNSGEILGGIAKVDEVVVVIYGLLNMLSASVMAIFIVLTLLFINAWLATIALVGLGGFYAAIFVAARRQLLHNSHVTSAAYGKRVETVQEGLGAIRDVLLDHAQRLFVRRFNEIDGPMRRAQAGNQIIGPSPRVAVEAIGIVLIAALAYTTATSSAGLVTALPALGALALGAQRLMPLIQQSYYGWVQLSANRQTLHDVVELLKQPMEEQSQMRWEPLPFDRELRFEQVSFRYQPHLPQVLERISLSIPKGARVGLSGTTGSGKSTAMDLLMGLLQPSEGRIVVDEVPLAGAARLAWQRNIAHVPQAIYLAAASFAENIAFGIPAEEVELERVRQAARQAQIAEFIESTPDGYATQVGERGVRLSGGQRQRVGIARALYKQATVLVFDEATSSLDSETETAVMEAIESLGREYTMVLIAHRLTTLQGCDVIYRLEKGRLIFSGTYQALISAPSAFLNRKAV
jgi:ABC-type bacteriocin/lantibiotic exporter with double-glycine peptidase domain